MKKYLTFALLLLCIHCSSQKLKISNSKSSFDILASDYLQVGVRMSESDNCYNCIQFTGSFKSESKDSVEFDFSTAVISRTLNSYLVDSSPSYLNDNSHKKVAKNDILYITRYKSKKKKKTREIFVGVAAVLTVGGLLTTLNSLVLADNNKRELLIAGGIQFGIGVALGISLEKKRKEFKSTDDPWGFN